MLKALEGQAVGRIRMLQGFGVRPRAMAVRKELHEALQGEHWLANPAGDEVRRLAEAPLGNPFAAPQGAEVQALQAERWGEAHAGAAGAQGHAAE